MALNRVKSLAPADGILGKLVVQPRLRSTLDAKDTLNLIKCLGAVENAEIQQLKRPSNWTAI